MDATMDSKEIGACNVKFDKNNHFHVMDIKLGDMPKV